MFKRDYFLLAMQSGLYLHKRWVLEAFAMTRPNPVPHEYTHGLTTIDDGRYAMMDKEQDDGINVIEDAMPGEPLFRPLEKLILRPGDLPNVRTTITTTYGNALVNQLILVYPFGDKIDFMSGLIKIPVIEKNIVARWDDNAPEEGVAPELKPIRTLEYHKFNEAVGQLPGFAQLCVPSATVKTMTADPAMIKRRNELLALNKDKLHDPVVLAEILKELTQMDRQWMKGDPGERFYFKDKSYDVVRLKVFIMQGISTGFGEAGELIPTSLDEAWDISKLPAMVNQLRDGSYGRGAQTALGGVEVKFNNRIFQNSTVVFEDCGTERGIEVIITKDNARHYEGNYEIKKGVSRVLTEAYLADKIGQTMFVRSPAYCRTEGANFCKFCVGDKIAETPQALGTYAAAIGSTMMYIFMKLMHGKSLKTQVVDLDTMLS
ncbi:RNA polymerase beta subunit [Xanthomonas phage RTH11]|nr:RNA polymerase beta subunit [Xanthomonas phage RTH11]